MSNVKPASPSIADAPSLIERLLPVQKLSAESYKEQMAVHGKTLTALGSYWKGRKPLILAKACILGCLLPATDAPLRDLRVFEMLMGMDDESLAARRKRPPKPRDITATVALAELADYFVATPANLLPHSSPIDWALPHYKDMKLSWRPEITAMERRRLEAQMLPHSSYQQQIEHAHRPEEVPDISVHIWPTVNEHLGTSATSIPELTEELGFTRFGHRPKVGDSFCGSGQIPFEAARLGCDTYAADLNPIACMLTWGALNIVGASPHSGIDATETSHGLFTRLTSEIDRLGVETDGAGWRGKVYLYCIEATCPQTGWKVPLMPSRVVSKGYRTVARLVPDPNFQRYGIAIDTGVDDETLAAASVGTVQTAGRGQDPYLVHHVDGQPYATKISTLRGDFRQPDGTTGNRLRRWEVSDFVPQLDDIYQERLYCIQWMRQRDTGRSSDYEFRAVTDADLRRDRIVEEVIAANLTYWQAKGWIPDVRIEPGAETARLQRERGWTHWHHLFNPRQLLIGGLINQQRSASGALSLAQELNWNSRLSTWNRQGGGGGIVQQTFINQTFNTLFDYGCRGLKYAEGFIRPDYKAYPLPATVSAHVASLPAADTTTAADIYVTDPPYGDAVKFEEILDFFIVWQRKNPPSEFESWAWDGRRALAISGHGEAFRRGMVSAYHRLTELMPHNGVQVIMFTHQSGSIWADMASIVWAAGLRVTAAWYVATETDSALRQGSYVKGTVLLVVRKRLGSARTGRDDLAWEIKEEVERQVDSLIGLNQAAKGIYRDENVFEDADIQMAGYAAALRVLTRYSTIDGRDMVAESSRPRVRGETTFVDELIAFAVNTANQFLVPQGLDKRHWDRLSGADRFYLKMLDLESRGADALDNYQNFAKAFKVRDFQAYMGDNRANRARLKSASEFARSEMGEGSEFYQSTVRAVLYALMELQNDIDGRDVLAHLSLNVPNYYGDPTQRDLAVELASYLAARLQFSRPEEAAAARVLAELVRNQRLG